MGSRKLSNFILMASLLLGLVAGLIGLAWAAPALAAGGATGLKVAGLADGLESTSAAQGALTTRPGLTLPPIVPSTSPLLEDTPVLTVTKTAVNEGGDPLRPGERITYTISLSNSGNVSATNVVVSDTFPANTSFVEDSIIITPGSAGGTPGGPGTQPVIASDITLAAQSLVTVTYAVTAGLPLDDGTLITNTASVTSSEVSTPTTGTLTSWVTATPAVTVVKEGPPVANLGETIVYTFTVINDGDTLLQDVVVEDDYAGVATFVDGDDGDDRLDLIETWIYTASYTILITDPDPLTNTVTVTAQDAWGTQVTNTATHTTMIEYDPALKIVKDGPATAEVGDVLIYSFNVTNDAESGDGSPISNVVVSDNKVGSIILLYKSGGNTDDILEVGETWVYFGTYTVKPTDPNFMTNTGTVTGWDLDDDLVSDTGTHTLNIEFAPAVSLVKSGPSEADVGETVVYTYTVSHAGGDGSPVSQVMVIDSLAIPVNLASKINSDADDWLEVGETWTYTASYTILVSDPNPLVNVGTIRGKDKDNDYITASGSHSTQIVHTPVLTITKSGPATVRAGRPINYTLTVVNSGQAVANNLVISDVIPSGATYVSGGTRDGDVVRWTVPSLAPDLSTQVSFVVSATTDITNSTYFVLAAGNVSAVGQEAVVTTITTPPPGGYLTFLPIVIKPAPTELFVFNDKTGGSVTLTVFGTGVSCVVPNNATQFCGSFAPGTYNVEVISNCGSGTFPKTYASGPQTTRVFCN